MSVIENVYHRVSQTAGLDKIVIAMPEGESDDALAAHVGTFCPNTARGSEADVLDRYFQAATKFEASTIIRITSDCPFFDPDILTGMLQEFDQTGPDYMTNTLDPHLPRGLDAEVFTMAALTQAWTEGNQPFHREHVTPYIYLSPGLFKIAGYRNRKDDRSDLRWTLDTPEDWDLIERMHGKLELNSLEARLDDFLRIYDDNPNFHSINSLIEQKKLTQ